VLFPESRGELIDLGCRKLPDTLQDIDKIHIRIDVLKSVRGDQRLGDTDVMCADFGPAEYPVSPIIGTLR
jgi:hypothetical protein